VIVYLIWIAFKYDVPTVPFLDSTVFYPSDAVSCEYAVGLAATTKGISYIRTCNFGNPVLYDNKSKFKLGQAHILRESPKDQVLLVGVGITTYEALKAAKELEKLNIYARVMDLFTIKPLDRHNLVGQAISCNRRVVTVEDHQFKGKYYVILLVTLSVK